MSAETTDKIIDNIFVLGEYSVVFFLDSQRRYLFCELEQSQLMPYIVPVVIKKSPLRTDIISNLSDERVFVYCKNNKIREKIKNFKFEKTLLHTGIKLSVKPLTETEKEKIMQNISYLKNPPLVIEQLNALREQNQLLQSDLEKKTQEYEIDKDEIIKNISFLKNPSPIFEQFYELKNKNELLQSDLEKQKQAYEKLNIEYTAIFNYQNRKFTKPFKK